jgi:hypothetical protein
MDKTFLYIDILGFEKLVESNSPKTEKIFEIIDGLNVHKDFVFQTIVFSDTILVFNKNGDYQNHYYVTYLIEYAQQLFYRLSLINIYFKGIITLGEFNFSKLNNIDAYYGLALIETYKDEKILEGFGLYINKNLSNEVIVFDKIDFNKKYDFVLLCQSFINLYKDTKGILPIDMNILSETDTYFRIDEDLRFFREIEYLKNNHPIEGVKKKHEKVYNVYKSVTPDFFQKFEEEGFLPFILNPGYPGTIDPFEILAESEMNNH